MPKFYPNLASSLPYGPEPRNTHGKKKGVKFSACPLTISQTGKASQQANYIVKKKKKRRSHSSRVPRLFHRHRYDLTTAGVAATIALLQEECSGDTETCNCTPPSHAGD
jgi:hypothetical protein